MGKHRVNVSQYDRERHQLENDLSSGLITPTEYNRQMRELDRYERDDFREAAELNAEQAYRDTYDF